MMEESKIFSNESIYAKSFYDFLSDLYPSEYSIFCSCSALYDRLLERFNKAKSDIFILYANFKLSKDRFIECYQLEIKATGAYNICSIPSKDVITFIKEHECTLEQLFESPDIIDFKDNPFPGYMNQSRPELIALKVSKEIINFHDSFQRNISMHFLDKLIDFINALVDTPKKKNNNNSEISFGFIGKPEELLDFIKTVHVKLSDNLVDEQQTSTQIMVDVLTADTIIPDTPEVHFSCQTTQIAYFFYKLDPLFDNLTFKSISNSKRFFTKNGNTLTETNLSKSKTTCNNSPKQKYIIDKAFQNCFNKTE